MWKLWLMWPLKYSENHPKGTNDPPCQEATEAAETTPLRRPPRRERRFRCKARGEDRQKCDLGAVTGENDTIKFHKPMV